MKHYPTLLIVGYMILHGILQFGTNEAVLNYLPESYIGAEALEQIHEYLLMWCFNRIVIYILPILFIMILYGLSRLRQDKELFSFSIGLIIAVFIGCVNFQYPNCFAMQMEQNQYWGTSLMKTVQFMADIEQDLQSDELQNVSAELSGYDIQRTGNIMLYEYVLQNTEDNTYIGQCSGQDYRQISESWYEVKLYSHSGLIASIDEVQEVISDES